jgi:RND family efflux transporter MFP subunit
MRARTFVVSGLLVTALAAVTAYQAGGRPVAASPASTASPADPSAASSTATLAVAAEGRVVAYPGAEVKVGAERSGRLLRVLVDESQAVRKGELLAEIESDELRASLDEARARIAELDADVHLAELDLRRRQDLADQQILAAHDLDQARRDLDAARARRETAAATVERYEAQIRKTRIVAPISGTVTARHVDAGEMVDAADDIVTLADLGRLRIEGEVHEGDAGTLAVGMPVAITAEGYPGQSWRGRVEEVPDSVTLRRLKPRDPSRPTDSRILAVKVTFAEKTPLKLGTTVELRIEPAAGRAR